MQPFLLLFFVNGEHFAMKLFSLLFVSYEHFVILKKIIVCES
jgi:hypothetical protein